MFSLEIPISLMKAVLSRYENIELFKTGEEKFMKVSSNVKAGPGAGNTYLNHNEKIISGIKTIEEKKSIGKKLRLSKETIRELKDGHLKMVAGGAIQTAGCTREIICYLK